MIRDQKANRSETFDGKSMLNKDIKFYFTLPLAKER